MSNHRALICGFLIAWLPQLMLGAVGRGVVLCQEADGNVGVEWSFNACCDPTPAARHDHDADASIDVAECCDDAPLALTLTRERADTLAAIPQHASSLWVGDEVLADPRPRSTPRATWPRPPSCAPLHALRTVVLRC